MAEESGVIPQIPYDTRWNSHNARLSTFTKFLPICWDIHWTQGSWHHHHHPEQHPSLQRSCWAAKVSVVSEALDALQSDSATVALVTDTWNKLLKTEMFAPHEGVINQRMEEAIEPFYVGNLMDPNNNGVKSQFRARRSSRKMYQRTKASLSAILSSIQDLKQWYSTLFCLQSGFWLRTNSPSKWWMLMEYRTAKKCTLPRGSCQYSKDLLSRPSYPLRFLKFGHLWSELRKRLGVEKVTKGLWKSTSICTWHWMTWWWEWWWNVNNSPWESY